jgi:3-deoxy-D-arabino-heptulosonate 7-phosphate (DAHP) synthase class II
MSISPAKSADIQHCCTLAGLYTLQCRELHKELVAATNGNGFLLMGGDCAESFDEFNVNHIRDTFCVILQMALIMTYGGAMPITKVSLPTLAVVHLHCRVAQ